MEPHEFLDFLSGRLTRRFVDSAATLEQRIAQLDIQPDTDGQFRVNDFFCYDDTWRIVLTRLVRESDAVIMDLRGFSSQNAGCIFEINELISLVPLKHVVFIVDDSTDGSFLRHVMQQAWVQMDGGSPNRLLESGAPQVVRLNQLGEDQVQGLLRILSDAVQPAPAPRGTD
jgi:hypothetical protein